MLLEKYEPKSIDEMIANRSRAKEVLKWLENWKSGALILNGPSGCGKSLAVKLIVKNLGFEILYFYGANLKEVLSSSNQASLFHKGKLIVAERPNEKLLKLRVPVIFICDNLYDASFRTIRKKCRVVKFQKPRVDSLLKFAKKVCENEGIAYTERALSQLIRMEDGDVRSLLLDLEVFRDAGIDMKALDDFGYREIFHSIFDVLKIIFKTAKIENVRDILRKSEKSIDEILFWLEENIAKEYERKEEIAKAFDFLSVADIFSARIIKRQAWSLKKYLNIAPYGVALSKKNPYSKFVMYSPPKLFFKKQNNEALQEISENLHCSTKKAMQYLPLIEKIG